MLVMLVSGPKHAHPVHRYMLHVSTTMHETSIKIKAEMYL